MFDRHCDALQQYVTIHLLILCTIVLLDIPVRIVLYFYLHRLQILHYLYIFSIGGGNLLYSFDASAVVGTTVSNVVNTVVDPGCSAKLNGAAIVTTGLKAGTAAVTFDCTKSHHVALPAHTTGAAGMSFSCWLKSTSSQTNSRIIDFGNGASSDNIIMAVVNDVLTLNVYRGSTPCLVSTGITVNDNVYRHIVWTLDTTGNWLVYINGVLVWSLAGQSYPLAIPRTTNCLGKSSSGSDPYFNGAIGDFRVYNRVLSRTECSHVCSGTCNELRHILGFRV